MIANCELKYTNSNKSSTYNMSYGLGKKKNSFNHQVHTKHYRTTKAKQQSNYKYFKLKLNIPMLKLYHLKHRQMEWTMKRWLRD